MISTSELSLTYKENNTLMKARVCGGEVEVHFPNGKIVMGKFEPPGLLQWGYVVDGNGAPLRNSSASPWLRAEVPLPGDHRGTEQPSGGPIPEASGLRGDNTRFEATSADALGRSWRTSPPKQLPMYQMKDYVQIGRPIPASSWSRVVQFAGSDTTFVHVITPYFHANGDVSMMMARHDIK